MKDSKSSLSILILFAIVFIAVFGVFSMNMAMEHGQGCWASVANNVVCPESLSPLASVNFHFQALEKFSLAVFQNSWSLFLLLALVFFVFVKIFISKQNLIRNYFYSIFRYANLIFKLSYSKFIYWLSLLENSPSFSYARYS